QFDGLGLIEIGLLGVVEFARRGACTVEDCLPAVFVAPGFQMGAVDAGALVVMKVIAQPLLIEPGAGLLHGVTGLDTVETESLGWVRHKRIFFSQATGWRIMPCRRPGCRTHGRALAGCHLHSSDGPGVPVLPLGATESASARA